MIDAVGRYAQLLCHEMNNPLTILYGQGELMRAALAHASLDEARVRTAIKHVEENTARVIALVAEMREALRQVDGEDRESTSLIQVVREAAAFSERMRRYRAGTLDIDVPAGEVLVRVRPVEIRGAIWRLVAGAVERSASVRVRVIPDAAGWAVIIAGENAPRPRGELEAPGLEDVLARNGITVHSWQSEGEAGLRLTVAKA